MNVVRFSSGLLLFVCAAFAQTPTITGVIGAGAPNAAAAVASRLCPGDLALVNGSNLGASTSISVTVAGKQAFVLNANNAQLRIQIPFDAPLGATTITAGSSAAFNITLIQFAPEITGVGDQNGNPLNAGNPGIAGQTITVNATGLGPTSPPAPTGTLAGGNYSIAATVAVTVGGVQATVQFAGLGTGTGNVGSYFIGVTLPSGGLSSGPQPVQLTVTGDPGTATSSNVFQIVYQAPPPLILINNYSGVAPGLPNYGIAPGSIFLILGSGLANSSTPFQNPPLQTTLSGVSVNVTVSGTTVHPFIYYITPTQLAAVLPSSTPVGDGQISVLNGSTTIGPAPIHVVQGAFGILTLNGVGTAMAAMLDVNFKFVGFTNSVQPGEYVNLFGSGVGPSPDSDQNSIAAPTNLIGTIPVSVFVGGQQAQVTYAGRSAYPGLDQIQFIVPSNVTPGCYVGVRVAAGNLVSNFPSMPIAATGRSCQEPTIGLSASATQTMLGKNSFNVGVLELRKRTNSTPGVANSTSSFDRVQGIFIPFTPSVFTNSDLSIQSLGSCEVYTFNGDDNGPQGAFNPTALLNAGPALNISGPNGKKSVAYQGAYQQQIGGQTNSGTLPVFIPASGAGNFVFDDGSGGPDVGAFTANMTTGPAPVWNNQNSITTINRGSPPTITWTGGNSNWFALITGSSATTGPIGQVGAAFSCAVPSTDGQFVLPAGVATSLPASAAFSPGFLEVQFQTYPQTFTASGIDFGFYYLQMIYTSNSVNYR